KFLWSQGVMTPIKGFGDQARRQFVDGEVYRLVIENERSGPEHRHYFACINDAFGSLNEKVTAEKIKTPEHLRKWALIETNWFNEVITDCGSKEVAMRMAAFTRKMDDYSEILVRGHLLVVRTAKSQTSKGPNAMSLEDCRQSKKDVLDLLSDMLGINRTILERYGGRSA